MLEKFYGRWNPMELKIVKNGIVADDGSFIAINNDKTYYKQYIYGKKLEFTTDKFLDLPKKSPKINEQ